MVHIHVVGAELEQIAREIVAEFKRSQPDEAAKWYAEVKARRQMAKDGHGQWETGVAMPAVSIPSWVYYTYGRVLGDPSWFPNDKVAVAALLRAIPEAKIIESDGLCEGDKQR